MVALGPLFCLLCDADFAGDWSGIELGRRPAPASPTTRLFHAAVDQFLAGPTDEAARSYLAKVLAPAAAATEKLTIQPGAAGRCATRSARAAPKIETVTVPI